MVLAVSLEVENQFLFLLCIVALAGFESEGMVPRGTYISLQVAVSIQDTSTHSAIG